MTDIEDWNHCAGQTVAVFLRKMQALIDQGKIDPTTIICADDSGCRGVYSEVIGVKTNGMYTVLLQSYSQDEDVDGGIPFAVIKKSQRKRRKIIG